MVIIVSDPLTTLLAEMLMWAGSYACLTRIQTYLLLPDQEDRRLLTETPQGGRSLTEKTAASVLDTVTAPAVVMENVVVENDNGRSVLNDVSVRIPAGSLAMIHGTVGSGKSVFLETILGEIQPSKGKITLSSKDISLAAQTSWIRNKTIRDNIIGHNGFDEGLYKEVLHGCALDVDISRLHSGDQTMAGTDGCNLSGGQKQRLVRKQAAMTRPQLTVGVEGTRKIIVCLRTDNYIG